MKESMRTIDPQARSKMLSTPIDHKVFTLFVWLDPFLQLLSISCPAVAAQF